MGINQESFNTMVDYFESSGSGTFEVSRDGNITLTDDLMTMTFLPDGKLKLLGRMSFLGMIFPIEKTMTIQEYKKAFYGENKE